MVRLLPQQSRLPEVEANLRQLTNHRNRPHHNTVQLSPFPSSSVANSTSNRGQPSSSTTRSRQRADRNKFISPMSNLSPRVNRVRLPSSTLVTSSSVSTQPLSSTSTVTSRVHHTQQTPISRVNLRHPTS